jgi:methylglyoxal synthase
LRAHKFFSSAHLSKFGQGLRSVRRPYVGLSKPTLDEFCDGHKDFLQLYRLMSTFSTVDHVKNAQSCVNRVNTLRGTFGGTFENQSSFSTGSLDPKSLIFIWDTGASYGLTSFRSDFIDYVKCAIPVRDVTKVNAVVGIGTTLHTTRCMVDTQKSIAIAYACY